MMPFNPTSLTPDSRQRLPTQNQMGFAHLLPLKVTQQLYQQAFQEKGRYADIGAAYGIDTLQLLQAGAKHVTAIDMDLGHLQFLEKSLPHQEAARLEICCQRFPEDCQLPPSFYEGILLSRVLIFLTPQNTESALHQIFQALKPGGKAYFITISPFPRIGNPSPSFLKNILNIIQVLLYLFLVCGKGYPLQNPSYLIKSKFLMNNP